MEKGSRQSGWLAIGGLIAVLALVRGFDALDRLLVLRLGASMQMMYASLWLKTLQAMVSITILLLLFWFLLNRPRKDYWIATLYVLVGAFLMIFPQIFFSPAFDWLSNGSLRNWLLSPSSATQMTGGLLAVIGLFSLVLPGSERS